jgi:hypothetical protein
MNGCDLSRIDNDLRHAERRHPVDFLEPTPANGDENIGRICEVLSRTFVWIADGSSLEQIGLRATVVLYCVRADLIGGETLEQRSPVIWTKPRRLANRHVAIFLSAPDCRAKVPYLF